jgi:hypothetical protein
VRAKRNKKIQSERLQSWYYQWDALINYAIVMASGGMVCIPSFITMGSDIQVILLLPKQFERYLVLLMGGIYEVRR